MSDSSTGVNISLREIYDSIQDVRNEVKGIGPKISQIEKDSAKGVEAHDLATEALRIAKELEDNKKWLWRTVVAGFITAIAAAIVGFMVLAFQFSIMQQVKDATPQPSPAVNVEVPQTNNEGGK